MHTVISFSLFNNPMQKSLAGGSDGKESTCQFRRFKRCQFYPWVWKFPWRRKWQSIPVFLPGESHGPRSLAGYSPWGHKESDTTKQLNMHTHTHTHTHTQIHFGAVGYNSPTEEVWSPQQEPSSALMKTSMTTDVSSLSDLQVPYKQVNRLHIAYLKLYVKKAKCRRTDAFELWCWRRLLRVPWTAS